MNADFTPKVSLEGLLSGGLKKAHERKIPENSTRRDQSNVPPIPALMVTVRKGSGHSLAEPSFPGTLRVTLRTQKGCQLSASMDEREMELTHPAPRRRKEKGEQGRSWQIENMKASKQDKENGVKSGIRTWKFSSWN